MGNLLPTALDQHYHGANITEPFTPFSANFPYSIKRNPWRSLIYALHPLTFHNLHNAPICYLRRRRSITHSVSVQSMAAEPASDGGAEAEKLVSRREEFVDSSNLFSAILAMALWLYSLQHRPGPLRRVFPSSLQIDLVRFPPLSSSSFLGSI